MGFPEETVAVTRLKRRVKGDGAMISASNIPANLGRWALLIVASWMSFLNSCPAGNTPSTALQQPLFANAPAVALQGGPSNVLVADMNNDRKPDLVVALSQSRAITVVEGKGNGQFGAALSTTTVTEPPGDMALGDLNGDGNIDVALTSHDSYGVVLLTGDGKGGLAKAANSPVVMKPNGQHPHTHGLAVADMNRDNKLDLITATTQTTTSHSHSVTGAVLLRMLRNLSPLVQAPIRSPLATSTTTAGPTSSPPPVPLAQHAENNFR
jgi:hypothetical protein